MPQLAALYKKYEPEGLHIVGLERQGSTEADTRSVAESKGAGYQIHAGGSISGTGGGGLPQGYLFDASGALVSSEVQPGTPLETKIKELLKEAAGLQAGPGPYKKLAPVVANLKAGMPVGAALKSILPKVQSKDAEEAGEAAKMVEALRSSGTRQITSALAKKNEDPAGSVAKLDKVALQYAGDEVGTRAKTESDSMKKDPAVKKELEADVMWKRILVMGDALKPVRGVKNPKDEAFRKQNLAAIQAMIAGSSQLTQRFAGTKAAAEAQALIDSYK